MNRGVRFAGGDSDSDDDAHSVQISERGAAGVSGGTSKLAAPLQARPVVSTASLASPHLTHEQLKYSRKHAPDYVPPPSSRPDAPDVDDSLRRVSVILLQHLHRGEREALGLPWSAATGDQTPPRVGFSSFAPAAAIQPLSLTAAALTPGPPSGGAGSRSMRDGGLLRVGGVGGDDDGNGGRSSSARGEEEASYGDESFGSRADDDFGGGGVENDDEYADDASDDFDGRQSSCCRSPRRWGPATPAQSSSSPACFRKRQRGGLQFFCCCSTSSSGWQGVFARLGERLWSWCQTPRRAAAQGGGGHACTCCARSAGGGGVAFSSLSASLSDNGGAANAASTLGESLLPEEEKEGRKFSKDSWDTSSSDEESGGRREVSTTPPKPKGSLKKGGGVVAGPSPTFMAAAEANKSANGAAADHDGEEIVNGERSSSAAAAAIRAYDAAVANDEFHEARYLRPRWMVSQRPPTGGLALLGGGSGVLVNRLRYVFETPTSSAIYDFMRVLFTRAKLTAESGIISLVYVERLMEATRLGLRAHNWRPIVMCGLLLASKVWDDLGSWNVEFAAIYPQYTTHAVNTIERFFVSRISFNLYVSGSVYAKYYFALRAMNEQRSFRKRFMNMVGAGVTAPIAVTKRIEASSKAAASVYSRSL